MTAMRPASGWTSDRHGLVVPSIGRQTRILGVAGDVRLPAYLHRYATATSFIDLVLVPSSDDVGAVVAAGGGAR